MALNIYTRTNTLRTTVAPNDSSTLTQELHGESVLAVSFVSDAAIAFAVGDYCEWEGNKYYLLERPTPQQRSTIEWAYDLRFMGVEGMLSRFVVLHKGQPTFTLTSKAIEHLKLIVASVNAGMGTTEWKVGSVADTALLVIDYNGTYAHTALGQVAEAAKLEWWIEGTTINIGRCEHGQAIPLAYGRGLINLSRDKAEGTAFYTRLYPIGSTRNIRPDQYGSERLRLASGATYIDTPDVATYGIIDHVQEQAFAHIYPRHNGRVSGITTERRRTEQGTDYLIYFFKDSALDFNPNTYQLPNEPLKITIAEGADLGGREFEVNFDPQYKRFEVITQWPYEDSNIAIPSEALPLREGDGYTLWNLAMPESYVRAAERELEEAARTYNTEQRRDISIYQGTTDWHYMQMQGIRLSIGQRIHLESEVFFPEEGFRVSRVTRLVQRLNLPEQAEVSISDAVPQRTLQLLEGKVASVTHAVRHVEQNMPDIVRSWESTTPTDTNIYSAKAVEQHQLSSRDADTAQGHITFKEGLSVGTYSDGLLGSGARIDQDGRAELQSLTLRQWLEVPELRYNRTSVHVGASFNSPAAGLVERVENKTATTGRIYLKLEQGELGTIEVGDLLMGIYHATAQQGGATKDSDDGRLNVQFAGFATAYFEAIAIDTAGRKWVDYRLRQGTTIHPTPFMTFASRGHRTLKARQQFVFATRAYTRYLADVNDWDIQPRHIVMQLGELSGINDPDHPTMQGTGIYCGNAYMGGTFRLKTSQKEVDAILQELESKLQHASLSVSIKSSAGTIFRNGEGTTTLTAHVIQGDKDITAQLPSSAFVWRRASHDSAADTAWENKHAKAGRSVSITAAEVGTQATYSVVVEREIPKDPNAPKIERNYALGTAFHAIELATSDQYVQRQYGFSPDLKARVAAGDRKVIVSGLVGLRETTKANPARIQIGFGFIYEDGSIAQAGLSVPVQWQGDTGTIPLARYHRIFEIPEGKRVKGYLNPGFFITGGAEGVVAKEYKVEFGDEPTPWIQAAEELPPPAEKEVIGEAQEVVIHVRDGARGEDGRNGTSSYTHIAYADTTTGMGLSQSPTNKACIGIYVDSTPTDSTDPTRYKWSLIKGAKGDQGVAGVKGTDGRTPYLHIAYASSADGRINFHLSDPTGRAYIGTYTDHNAADSNNAADYTWSLIKGEKGDQGVRGVDGRDGTNGRGIASVVKQYYLSTSKDSQQEGSWVTTPPMWQANRYLWTREIYNYTDGTSTITPPTCSSEWEAINLLEVGGRNFFGFQKGVTFGTENNAVLTSAVTEQPDQGGLNIKITKAGDSGIIARLARLGFERAGYYTLSCDIRCNRAIPTPKLNINLCNSAAPTHTLTAEWQRISFTSYVNQYYSANDYNGFVDVQLYAGHGLQVGDIIQIRHLMIERGNMASDYKQAEEDVQWAIDNYNYLKKLFQQPTGMERGSVFGGMLQARDGDQVTAFLNGLRGKPAFAAGVENYGASNERYRTAFDFDGGGHVGDLHFRTQGGDSKLYIADDNGTERVRLSKSEIPELAHFLGLANGEAVLNSQAIDARVEHRAVHEATKTSDTKSRDTLVVGQSGGVLQLSGNCRYEAEGHSIHDDMRVQISLRDHDNPYYEEILSVTKITPPATGLREERMVRLDVTKYDIPQGRYYVNVGLYNGGYRLSAMVRVSGSVKYDQVDKRTYIASNGLASCHSKNQYVYIQNGLLQAKGQTNLPGVLYAGRYDKTGQVVNVWGMRGNPRPPWRSEQGSVRVYHNVGHTNYTVQLTPFAEWTERRDAMNIIALRELQETYFVVTIFDTNGNPRDGSFCFTVYGSN